MQRDRPWRTQPVKEKDEPMLNAMILFRAAMTRDERQARPRDFVVLKDAEFTTDDSR